MTRKVDQIELDFPVLFRANREMAIGDGWHQIVHELAAAIELESYKAGIPMDSEHYPMVVQVKEKFGTLRFYMYNATDEMKSLIGAAEEKTHTTCEMCGETGEMRRDSGWHHVSCDACEVKI